MAASAGESENLQGLTVSRAYWEIIADNLRARGWSVGWAKYVTAEGRDYWQADAHCDDGRRFVAQAEELSVAFAELERMTNEVDNGNAN